MLCKHNYTYVYLSLGRCSYIVETNTLEPLKRCLAKSSFRSAKQRFWKRKRIEIYWGTHARSDQDHIFNRVPFVNPFRNTTERGYWNASKSPKGLKESEVARHNQQEIRHMPSFVMKLLWLEIIHQVVCFFFSWFQCRNRRERFNLSTSSPWDLNVKEIAKEERENWSLVCFGTLIFFPCFGSMFLYFMLFYPTNHIKIKDLNCLDLSCLDYCFSAMESQMLHVIMRFYVDLFPGKWCLGQRVEGLLSPFVADAVAIPRIFMALCWPILIFVVACRDEWKLVVPKAFWKRWLFIGEHGDCGILLKPVPTTTWSNMARLDIFHRPSGHVLIPVPGSASKP